MDGTASLESFQQAARFDSELTDRQREVLRLIAAGKTNGEIAEALDMTLAGAKWHVSEVLTKLALPSREAAAAYYRWREAPARRLSRLVRGLVPMAWWKLGSGAAGVAGAAIAGFIVVNGLHQEAPDVGPAVPGLPFAMESIYTRTTDHTAINSSRRYWYESNGRQRTEIDPPEVTRADAGYELGFDSTPGTTTILIDAGFRTRADALSYVVTDYPVVFPERPDTAAALGPLPYKSLDEAIINLSGSGGDASLLETRRLGESRVVGIRVEGVEFLGRDSAGTATSYNRIWIDTTRMLLLRRETWQKAIDGDGYGEFRDVEVATRLSYGAVDPSKFAVQPQRGAVTVTCPSLQQLSGDPTLLTPFVPIPEGTLPPDLRWLSWGVAAAASGGCDTAHVVFEDESQGNGAVALFLNEDTTIPPGFLVDAEQTDISGQHGGTLVDPAGNQIVRFIIRDTAIELRSDRLSIEELVTIAKAMVEHAH